MASGESQYVSERQCEEANEETLLRWMSSWLPTTMVCLSVISKAASRCPSSDDDAKTASSSGDEVVSSHDGAMELPPFNNLPCRLVLFVPAASSSGDNDGGGACRFLLVSSTTSTSSGR